MLVWRLRLRRLDVFRRRSNILWTAEDAFAWASLETADFFLFWRGGDGGGGGCFCEVAHECVQGVFGRRLGWRFGARFWYLRVFRLFFRGLCLQVFDYFGWQHVERGVGGGFFFGHEIRGHWGLDGLAWTHGDQRFGMNFFDSLSCCGSCLRNFD